MLAPVRFFSPISLLILCNRFQKRARQLCFSSYPWCGMEARWALVLHYGQSMWPNGGVSPRVIHRFILGDAFMVLNGWAKWGRYLAFLLLLWISLQNVGIMFPRHDFEMTFMPVPVNAHAWAWVISVMFLKHLGTNSMQDPLLNVFRAIKGRKRGKEQRFVEYSMESRGWNATLNYSWLEISWGKKKSRSSTSQGPLQRIPSFFWTCGCPRHWRWGRRSPPEWGPSRRPSARSERRTCLKLSPWGAGTALQMETVGFCGSSPHPASILRDTWLLLMNCLCQTPKYLFHMFLFDFPTS